MRINYDDGRTAGLLYLLMGLPAAFSIMFVYPTLIVPGDASATARSILASEPLFRLGIVCELLSATASIFLARSLYRLLRGVNPGQASLLTILLLMAVPISFLNGLNAIAVLALLHAPALLAAFTSSQLEALAMLFVNLHRYGLVLAGVFWGLWLFPFGALVMASRSVPRVLGVLLIANGIAYVVASLASLIAPEHAASVNRIALIPEAIGETAIVAWLLVKGAKVHPLREAAA